MAERESIGQYLKRERENRKISLREVSKQIRVREPFLKAVEEDRHDLLPSATYVKGFLSAYAKYLDLDPREILHRYEIERKGEIPVQHEAPARKKITLSPKALWWVGGLAIVGFVVIYLLVSSSPPPMVVPPQTEIQEAIHETPSAPVSEKPAGLGAEGMTLEMKAVERTWVAIKLDGQPVREAMFHPGENFTCQASNRIELVLGNAGGVEMTFNKRRLERLGGSGEVVTVILTPQGVETIRRGLQKPREE